MKKLGATTFASLFILLLLSLAFIPSAFASVADPSEIGVGARPLGMGKAFVGIANDGNAIYLNPAGLADFKTLKITSMSGTMLQDVQYLIIGAASPFKFGTLGIGYINVGIPRIPMTTLTGAGTPEFTGDYTDYNAGLFFLSYGSRLDRFLPWDFAKDVAVGASAKIFLQGFTGGGASIEGASGTGLDMDFGLQYKPVKWGSLGVNLINALPMSLGGKFTWPPRGSRTEVYEDSIPMLMKVGGAIKVWGDDGIERFGDNELIVALDMDIHPTAPRPSLGHLGVEWLPVKSLALRLGVDQKPAATESGVGIESNLTGGVGVKHAGFTFDYAYHQYGDLSENVTHFFSLGFVGDEEREEKIKRMEEIIRPTSFTTTEPVIKSTVKQKPSLKTFSDVPKGYWAKDAIEYLATLGIIGGYPDGTFRPENPLTRAELSTILVRGRGIEPSAVKDDPYPDLPADHWASRYVKAGSDLKLVSGYPDGMFKAGKKVSRAEAVVVIMRFAEAPMKKGITSPSFPDLSISHWASPAVWTALDAGMLDYLNGSNFEPNRLVTRAEVTEMLSKTPWGKAKIKELLSF
jgi:hypothetical protein